MRKYLPLRRCNGAYSTMQTRFPKSPANQTSPKTRSAGFALLAMMWLPLEHSHAQDDFFDAIDVNTETLEESPVSFLGYFQQDLRYGISQPPTPFSRQKSGVSTARTTLFGEMKIEGGDSLLGLNANNHWQISAKAETNLVQWKGNENSVTPNHTRLLLKDAYFDTRLENDVWVRVGHQVIAWGESEGLPIADIIAPQDSRTPGQAELRDLREQVPALKVNIPFGNAQLEWVTTYQAGSNRLASNDEPFYPYTQLDSEEQAFTHQSPNNDWETALKYQYSFNGGDIALIAGDINDNSYSISSVENEVLIFKQARVTTLAAVLNKTYNDWLFKAEAGNYWNQPILGSAPFRTDQLRLMGGLEYSGWQNWRVNMEINGAINKDTPEPDSHDSAGHVLRVSHNALNERLNNQLWLLSISGDLGQVLRWDIQYAWSDRLQLSGGVTLYDSNNSASPYYAFKHHDDVMLSIKYSFY